MTQLLDRIDAALALASNECAIAELLAKKAEYLARTGATAQARTIIDSVRERFNDGRSGRVTIRLLLAEGVLSYHAFEGARSVDKFARAHFLAEGMRDVEMIALTSAWKAFSEFDLSRFESMDRFLCQASDHGFDKNHAALSRLAITVMNSAILLGKREIAQKWFQFGHGQAAAEGDLACIDAFLFNRAVFGLARQRVAWCRGEFDEDWAATLNSELESARNLKNLVGITTMRDHIELCIWRLSLLRREIPSAAMSYPAQDWAAARFASKHVNDIAIQIERLYYFARVNGASHVANDLQRLNITGLDSLDPDERLVALIMLVKMRETFDLEIPVVELNEKTDAALDEYLAYETRLRVALERFLNHSTLDR